MLLNIEKLTKIYNISPNGILHIGAHKGEEKGIYGRLNWNPIYWVEAQSELADTLRLSLIETQDKVFNAAIWDLGGIQIDLKITNNSESTSLLNLGSHKENYSSIQVIKTERVETIRLDELLENEKMFNFLNLDIQGVELRALKSLGSRIADVTYIYTEVNKEEVYEGCDHIRDMDTFLKGYGFERVATRWVLRKGWGDALYIKNAHRKSQMQKIVEILGDIDDWYLPQVKSQVVEALRRFLPKFIYSFLKAKKKLIISRIQK